MVNLISTVSYTTTQQDSVRAITLSPEFRQHKPEVVASARLVMLCEWPCMDMLRQLLTPKECSLGVWQKLQHLRLIRIGTEVHPRPGS